MLLLFSSICSAFGFSALSSIRDLAHRQECIEYERKGYYTAMKKPDMAAAKKKKAQKQSLIWHTVKFVFMVLFGFHLYLVGKMEIKDSIIYLSSFTFLYWLFFDIFMNWGIYGVSRNWFYVSKTSQGWPERISVFILSKVKLGKLGRLLGQNWAIITKILGITITTFWIITQQ